MGNLSFKNDIYIEPEAKAEKKFSLLAEENVTRVLGSRSVAEMNQYILPRISRTRLAENQDGFWYGQKWLQEEN